MILHARFEGVHADLIHSPYLTRSLMLDERLAQSSPCIIITTFSLALYRCLFFHRFSSLYRSDHVEKNSFHAWFMKLSFHQVFIHPQRTLIEWVMSVLLRHCNLSKLISDCTSLNVLAISPCTGLQIHRSWMRWNRHLIELMIFNFFFLEHVWPGPQNWWKQRRPFLRLGDGDARVCNSFGCDFSPLNLCLIPCMVS
jgi:hypothetical protein